MKVRGEKGARKGEGTRRVARIEAGVCGVYVDIHEVENDRSRSVKATQSSVLRLLYFNNT